MSAQRRPRGNTNNNNHNAAMMHGAKTADQFMHHQQRQAAAASNHYYPHTASPFYPRAPMTAAPFPYSQHDMARTAARYAAAPRTAAPFSTSYPHETGHTAARYAAPLYASSHAARTAAAYANHNNTYYGGPRTAAESFYYGAPPRTAAPSSFIPQTSAEMLGPSYYGTSGEWQQPPHTACNGNGCDDDEYDDGEYDPEHTCAAFQGYGGGYRGPTTSSFAGFPSELAGGYYPKTDGPMHIATSAGQAALLGAGAFASASIIGDTARALGHYASSGNYFADDRPVPVPHAAG